MKLIFRYLSPHKWFVVYSIFFKVIGTLADIILPFIISYTLDEIVPTVDHSNLNPIILIGGLMLFVAVIGWVFNVIANRSSEKIASLTVNDIRNDLFGNILLLSPTQVDEVQLSSLIARMTNDTYNIYQVIGSMQRLGIRAPILFIGGIIMSFLIDPVLSLIMLAILPLVVIVVWVIFSRAQKMYRQIHEQSDEVMLVLRENIVGQKTIRALSMNTYEINRFDKAVEKLVERELKATILMNKIKPIVDFLLNTGLVLVLILGSLRVTNNLTTIPNLIVLLTYYTFVINAIMSITRVFMNIARSNISGNRIQKVEELVNIVKQGSESIIEKSEVPHIQFTNLSFSYHSNVVKDKETLNNLNFSINEGETLAIIGSTGSGKSTLIKLLLRFYEPKNGSIKIFGKNIVEYNLNELRKHFGVVLQDDLVFSDTIYENIRFYRDEITEEDVMFASKIAQATFIDEKEGSMDYHLSQRGANLSGGQRQRLLIARALAHRPSVIILDDSSSALDYKTDHELRKQLNTHFKKTTKIIIAQRISSVKDADKIILLDQGKIVGIGSHNDLINENELYKTIFEHQAGDIDNAL